MAKRKRPAWQDDGRTVARMNVPGMPWHEDSTPAAGRKGAARPAPEAAAQEDAPLVLSRKERRAIMRAMYSVLMPFALGVVALAALVLLCLQWFWLK